MATYRMRVKVTRTYDLIVSAKNDNEALERANDTSPAAAAALGTDQDESSTHDAEIIDRDA